MEDNRGMDRALYETERRLLIESLRDLRAGKFRADRTAMYIENTRRTMADIRRARYAKKGSRLYRLRDR